MKIKIKLLITAAFCFVTFLLQAQQNSTISLEGKWVRMTQTGPVAIDFKNNGKVEVDFGNDQTVDVVTEYKIENNSIIFTDTDGAMCPEPGEYKLIKTENYMAFDLIDDMCNGRIKMTMGFWTKPNFDELLTKLNQKISANEDPNLKLARARIYLALGKSKDAKADFDIYLNENPNDARALINRAGTRFPSDMEGVINDCNKAIALDSGNKNAYFLRGLAKYELGEKEKACEDFSRAIELGFSILRIAEEQQCAEYWKNK